MKRAVLLSLGSLAFAAATYPADAADVPVKAAIIKAPTVHFDWTGWYGGINYGTGLAQSQGEGVAGTVDRAGSGFSAGLQGGYNWQFNRHGVFGIEADISWLGIDRTRFDWGGDGTFGVEANWYGTLRGRLGYTSSPSLFYVTGGGAFVHVKNRVDTSMIGGTSTSASQIAGGWTAGWGIETMLGGNWSARSEYLYIDAGSQSVFNPAFGGTTTAFDNGFHVFRSALNYRFGTPTPSAGALPAHDWTGFYAGLNAGVGASQVAAQSNTFSGSFDIAAAGFTGGAQAGYNFQVMPGWIAGVEADIGWLGIDRHEKNWGSDYAFGVSAGWYATVRGRVARNTGPALLYLTGGAAFVDVSNRFAQFPVGADISESNVATGWTIGSGIEAALGGNWTARTEYLYIDAGSQSVFSPATNTSPTTRYENRFHIFRFGVNRRFSSGSM